MRRAGLLTCALVCSACSSAPPRAAPTGPLRTVYRLVNAPDATLLCEIEYAETRCVTFGEVRNLMRSLRAE